MRILNLRISHGRLIYIFPVILFLLLTAQRSSAQSLPVIHKPLADFTLESVAGGEVSLSDFAGKENVILITYRGWIGYW